jgi:aryl-alcohol dehydrogenase-like predicted oxidoreductase
MVMVHSNGDDENIMTQTGVLETLLALKQAGSIRAIGVSTKTVAGGKMALDLTDFAMVTYNPVQTEEQSVIAYAATKNKGILIKKALASGHIQQLSQDADPVRAALQFICREKGVSSIVIGTLNKAHLHHAVASVTT